MNMVLTPRITGTNMVPNGGGRYAAAGAVPSVDYTPVNEPGQISSLIYEGDSEFQYDQFSAEQQYPSQQEHGRYIPQQNFDHFGRLFEQTMERPVNFSLLGNTSESFAAAFEMTAEDSKSAGGRLVSYPAYALDSIIDIYENNAKIIYGQIAPKGEKLNVVL